MNISLVNREFYKKRLSKYKEDRKISNVDLRSISSKYKRYKRTKRRRIFRRTCLFYVVNCFDLLIL